MIILLPHVSHPKLQRSASSMFLHTLVDHTKPPGFKVSTLKSSPLQATRSVLNPEPFVWLPAISARPPSWIGSCPPRGHVHPQICPRRSLRRGRRVDSFPSSSDVRLGIFLNMKLERERFGEERLVVKIDGVDLLNHNFLNFLKSSLIGMITYIVYI